MPVNLAEMLIRYSNHWKKKQHQQPFHQENKIIERRFEHDYYFKNLKKH